MYVVLASETFKKQYSKLQKNIQKRILKGLKELEIDPVTPRTNADIIQVKNTSPQKYRIRIGEYRVIFIIEYNNTVKIIEMFTRGRGYRKQ